MISIEEQKEELESLKREVDQLRRNLGKKDGDHADLEREVANINRAEQGKCSISHAEIEFYNI